MSRVCHCPVPRGSAPNSTDCCSGRINEACSSDNDCSGQLACMNGECNDDPSVGTHISAGAPPSPSSHRRLFTCPPSGSLTSPTITPDMCNSAEMSDCCVSGKTYTTYDCSPPITAPTTTGTLTLNGFGDGESGGGSKTSCTNRYYSSSDLVVALSMGWFNGGSRCGKTIIINGNGRTTTATVVDVDECDKRAGCDAENAYQPPCPLLDDVDASPAVWNSALGVSESDGRYGEMSITWSQVDRSHCRSSRRNGLRLATDQVHSQIRRYAGIESDSYRSNGKTFCANSSLSMGRDSWETSCKWSV